MIPKRLVVAVLARDGGCVLGLAGCSGVATVADHRVNRGMGGGRVLNDPAALVAACGRCNSAREDATGVVLLDLRERGIKVRPASTHAASLERARLTPVKYPDGSWWLLDSDGGRRTRVKGGEDVALV